MKRLIVCIIAGWFLATALYAQEAEPRLAARLRAIESRLDSLALARQDILDRAQPLTQEIAFLQSKELLSGSERRKLADHMRQSQALEHEEAGLSSRQRQEETEHGRVLNHLLGRIQAGIDSLSGLTTPPAEKIADWVQQRDRWAAHALNDAGPVGGWTAIFARPDDPPRTLRLKADLLKDREAVLRHEADLAARRIEDLAREARLRASVARMDRELSLFNPSEDLLNRSGVSSASYSNDASPASDREGAISADASSFPSVLLGRPTMELNGPAPNSAQGLKTWITRIEAYRQRLIRQADSLAVQAARFHAQAGEHR